LLLLYHKSAEGVKFFVFQKKKLSSAEKYRKDSGGDCFLCYVSAPSKLSPSLIVQYLKGITGRKMYEKFPDLRQQLWKEALWNHSYYLETIGDISEETIRKYIEHQSKQYIRPEGINSAFCQNAFDAAVVQISSRLNNIRLDLLPEGMGIFDQSKVLFAMSIMGCSKQKMEETMQQIEGTFYEDCVKTLHELSEKKFSGLQMEFQERSKSLEYRLPKLCFVSVPLDSRLMKIEQSTDTKMPYVIMITNPLKTRQRITIPIDTSSHSLRRNQRLSESAPESAANGSRGKAHCGETPASFHIPLCVW
jgi:hypothetical protein